MRLARVLPVDGRPGADTIFGDAVAPRIALERDGCLYDVEVLVSANDEIDGPRYELLEVMGQTPASLEDRFDLELTPKHVVRLESHRIDLVSGTTVFCSDTTVCNTVAEAMRHDDAFRLTLGHLPNGKGFVAHAAAIAD